jgi:hypothetical protein
LTSRYRAAPKTSSRYYYDAFTGRILKTAVQ